jgi:hypothetical protein
MITGNLIQENQFKEALKYSENPEALEKVLREGSLSIHAVKLGTFEYFEGDREKRDVYEIIIKRNGKAITFRYGDSIHNTQIYAESRRSTSYYYAVKIKEMRESSLYSILACILAEYYCPDTFEEFCSAFGCDTDSIKAENLFRNCREQSKKLQSIFTSEEMESFPS